MKQCKAMRCKLCEAMQGYAKQCKLREAMQRYAKLRSCAKLYECFELLASACSMFLRVRTGRAPSLYRPSLPIHYVPFSSTVESNFFCRPILRWIELFNKSPK